jgi:hypothetical protein
MLVSFAEKLNVLSVGCIRGHICLFDLLNLDEINAARRVHFDDMTRPLAIERTADRADRGDAIVANIRVTGPGECINLPLARLDVANVNVAV